MSDDHASHAISAYTSNISNPPRPKINETPHIDRLAKEGMRLDNCFCTNAVCAPSRAAILTGTYNHINGVTTLSTRLDNSKQNVAKILQANGYQTAMIGKWHLGHKKENDPSGFDYWNVLIDQGFYFNPIVKEMGKIKRLKGYATDLITDYSLNWLNKRDKTRPFFLCLHHKAPHRPWEPDKKHIHMYEDKDLALPKTFDDDYKDRASAAAHARMRIGEHFNTLDLKARSKTWLPKFIPFFEMFKPPADITKYKLKNRDGKVLKFNSQQELKEWKYQQYMKDYLRCIAAVDDNVGRVLEYLDHEGLTDNTLVIYTSDQGFFLGDHGWFDKRFMYEESLRMPFLIRYPKEIKPQTVNSDIVLNVDFPSLFLDVAGIPIPAEMQGRSFRSLLHGHTPADWRTGMYYRYWTNGTFHRVYAHYGIRTLKYKLIYYYCDPLGQPGSVSDPHEPEWELFDLEKDPYEMHNVYHEPAYSDVVKELTRELARLQQECKDVPYPSQNPAPNLN
jgi:arylsulfatase A-like enzyme